jgi:hypothetical protein
VALLTGFRTLLIVVGLLYVVAFVLARRFRLLADRDLVDERMELLPGVATST